MPREVANIKIQRAGASVSEFCIELHPAADLGVRQYRHHPPKARGEGHM